MHAVEAGNIHSWHALDMLCQTIFTSALYMLHVLRSKGQEESVVCVGDSLHVLGFEVFHDGALQEGPGGVVGGHDVSLPVPGQLLQGVPTAAQPPLAVRHPVEALAICMEAVAEPPHLRHYDEVLSVKPACMRLQGEISHM